MNQWPTSTAWRAVRKRKEKKTNREIARTRMAAGLHDHPATRLQVAVGHNVKRLTKYKSKRISKRWRYNQSLTNQNCIYVNICLKKLREKKCFWSIHAHVSRLQFRIGTYEIKCRKGNLILYDSIRLDIHTIRLRAVVLILIRFFFKFKSITRADRSYNVIQDRATSDNR